MEFDPDRTALVVVDMQNEFCHPDGNLYAPASEDVIEPDVDLVDAARAAGANVVFTRDVHPPDQFERNHSYDEFERWGEHVVDGSWGTQIVPELDGKADHVVEKHTYDAFYNTELEGWLNARNVDELVFCGTLASICVLHTAGSAGLRDFETVLVGDAIGSLDDHHHEYAMDHAGWLFGEVVTADEVGFAG